MLSLTTLLTVLGSLNIIALTVFYISTSSQQHRAQDIVTDDLASYSFNDPVLAFKILEKLDVPKELGHGVRSDTYLGLKRDPNFCTKARGYLVDHPEFIFKEINFLSDYLPKSLTRSKVIPEVGIDAMPHISYNLPKAQRESPTYNINYTVNTVFTNSALHSYLKFATEIGCLTQTYNHVPGIGTLNRKDHVASNANAYAQKYKNRPQCFDGKKFFPKTWILDEMADCQEWFKIINSPEYEQMKKDKTIVYIRKLGVGGHQGKGVQPVNEEEEKAIREKFENGAKCGQMKTSYIVQNYVHNPLLVEGHKFDFRIYMMVASTNPLIVYYHEGFLRVSLYEYDVTKNEKGMHLTNTAQSIKVIKEAAQGNVMGMNETELLNFQMWNYTRLADYLIKAGKIESRDWITDYLEPAFHHSLQHLIRMTQRTYFAHSGVWELFGMDFMLDDDLNLWFIECNSGPVLKGSNPEKELLVKTMMKDQFEIVTNLLRSRIKRVIRYVNWLDKEGLAEHNGKEVTISKLEQRKAEFAEILKNRFEEEFETSSDNTWVKIVDESIEGLGRYNGAIRTECFD